MMGVSGSGMSGVASLATKMGYEVTGCDIKSGGHNPDHLKEVDLLVVTPAIFYNENPDPELQLGKTKNIVTTWEEFLGTTLSKNKKMIAVAGTHGKSTTTGMVGKLLEDNGFDPLVLIGANVKSWGGNSRFGNGDYFVVEADEFNDNFLHYNPEIIILNNIEFDHPDYFNSEKQLFESFRKFIERLIGDKILIVNWDNEGVRSLIESLDLVNFKLVKYSRETSDINLNLKVLGDHNVTNALGVIELGRLLEIDENKIVESIEGFEGIGRRMEEISKNVFDDYAHHPTAIKTTLNGVRNKFPDARIWAIIEPHGFKRTKALLSFYENAFNSVDKVLIGPIYKARDVVDDSINPNSIVKVSKHENIRGCNSMDEILDIIRNEKQDNDIFVIMGAGNSNKWAKTVSLIINGTSFKDITTLKVGGKIKFYFEVNLKEELVEKIKFAKNNNLPIFTIGGGTDIAVADEDFDGVVIKYIGNKITFINNIVTAESGAVWDKMVEESVNRNFAGIECLSGIPGTVGASPIQNIGAYGQELSETFVKLTAYDIENQKFVEFTKDDCKFGYRESIFKQKEYWQKFIITDITLQLTKYEDKDLELQTIRDEILRVRSEKLEDPKEIPNAGSFFKNPIVSERQKEELLEKYKDLNYYSFNTNFKIPAGWLIEKAEWKGKALGPVKVSDKHALIITNPEGKGTFNDVKKLADKIIEDVHKMFGIILEPEVQYINI
jgi:UDP-N-acetylmuramate--alanine ligase